MSRVNRRSTGFMGTVIDLQGRRRPKNEGETPERFVVCAQCGERHPLVRMTDGAIRCVTAFPDQERWFCRNRGCRAAWIEQQEPEE